MHISLRKDDIEELSQQEELEPCLEQKPNKISSHQALQSVENLFIFFESNQCSEKEIDLLLELKEKIADLKEKKLIQPKLNFINH